MQPAQPRPAGREWPFGGDVSGTVVGAAPVGERPAGDDFGGRESVAGFGPVGRERECEAGPVVGAGSFMVGTSMELHGPNLLGARARADASAYVAARLE